jgi:hypothetical protein
MTASRGLALRRDRMKLSLGGELVRLRFDYFIWIKPICTVKLPIELVNGMQTG